MKTKCDKPMEYFNTCFKKDCNRYKECMFYWQEDLLLNLKNDKPKPNGTTTDSVRKES